MIYLPRTDMVLGVKVFDFSFEASMVVVVIGDNEVVVIVDVEV